MDPRICFASGVNKSRIFIITENDVDSIFVKNNNDCPYIYFSGVKQELDESYLGISDLKFDCFVIKVASESLIEDLAKDRFFDLIDYDPKSPLAFWFTSDRGLINKDEVWNCAKSKGIANNLVAFINEKWLSDSIKKEGRSMKSPPFILNFQKVDIVTDLVT